MANTQGDIDLRFAQVSAPHLTLWLGLAWLGLAWLGLAWLGLAWLGLAWLGLAGLCVEIVSFYLTYNTPHLRFEDQIVRVGRKRMNNIVLFNFSVTPSSTI